MTAIRTDTDATQLEVMEFYRPIREGRGWDGTLTEANADEFVERLRALLSGFTYTMISMYEFKGFDPEIRCNQMLEKRSKVPMGHECWPAGSPFNISYDRKSSVMISDSYGVSFISMGSDFSFKRDMRSSPLMVTIQQKMGNGQKAIWVYAASEETVADYQKRRGY